MPSAADADEGLNGSNGPTDEGFGPAEEARMKPLPGKVCRTPRSILSPRSMKQNLSQTETHTQAPQILPSSLFS